MGFENGGKNSESRFYKQRRLRKYITEERFFRFV